MNAIQKRYINAKAKYEFAEKQEKLFELDFMKKKNITNGDGIITDLHENMAAEQKARTTYDNILRLTDDPDVRDPIKFLREREIVHFQRFGETKRELSSKSPNAESPHPRNHKRINKISNVRM